jgi:hypothetical protein
VVGLAFVVEFFEARGGGVVAAGGLGAGDLEELSQRVAGLGAAGGSLPSCRSGKELWKSAVDEAVGTTAARGGAMSAPAHVDRTNAQRSPYPIIATDSERTGFLPTFSHPATLTQFGKIVVPIFPIFSVG